MKTELKAAISQLSAERNLPKEIVLSALESALAFRKKKSKSGLGQDVAVKVDPESGEINFYVQKATVESVTNPNREISIKEARNLRATAQLGDVINIECTPQNIGRIAVNAAQQVVRQHLPGPKTRL